MKKFYSLILALITFLAVNAQVTVTPPTPLTVSGCSFPTAYSPLGDITITENVSNDISGTGDFILTAPADFEFQPGVGSVNATALGDLTITGLSITASTITFTINVNTTSNLDVITISGLQVRGVNAASGPSDILRTGGTSIVLGDETTDGIGHGSLTSVLNPPPTVSAGSPFTITCTANTSGAAIGETNDPTATYSWSPAAGLSSTTASNPTANPATTTTYTVTKTTTATGCQNTASVTVTVNNTPPTVSAGSPFTITCTANTSGAAIGETNDPTATYSWSPAAGLSSTTVSNPTANPATTTTYTVTKTTTATGCQNTASVTVTVNNTPPTVSAGSPFTITCTANTSGAAIGETNDPTATYSWSPAAGLSSTTVSNPTANPATTTTYTVTKTVTATGCTNTASVTVTVNNTPPTVSAGSPFTKTCVSNTSGAAIGETNDPTATYSWSPAAGLSSTTVSNPTANPATTTTYTVTKTVTATGCTNTASVTVTINNTPPTVSAGSPFTKTCVSNTSGAAIGETNDPTATYSWSPAAGLSSTTVSNPTANPAATTTYTVTKTVTATGCTNTASVTVTVDNTVPTVNITGSSSICIGGTTNLSPTSGGTWVSSDNSIATVTNAGVVTGVSAGNVTFTFTETVSGCTNTTPSITVNPTPVGSASPQTICSGATSNVALSSTVGSTTYTWTAAIQTTPTGGTITGFSNSSGTPIAQTLTNTGTTAGVIRYTVTPTANGCPGATFTVDVTVNPKPVGSASPQTICSGATSNVALSSTVGSTTYTWTAAIQTTPTGGTITGFSNSSGTPIAQTLTNTGTTLGVIRYTVTPTANGCPGATFTVDVTVNPNPVGSASPQTICSGATSNVALSSTVGSTTYTWTAAIQTTPTGGTITGFSNSSGTPIAQTLTNTGTTLGVIRYTVTPTANGCPGATFTVDVTVNPKPVGSASPQTICSGATSNVALSSTVGSTTYTWTAAIQTTPTGGTITGFSNSSGTPIAQTLTNTGTTLGVIRYTVTPTANGCPGATFTVDVTVNPKPVGSASPQTICSGATSNVALSSTVGSTTYTWTAAIQTTPTGGTITGFSNSSGTPIAQTLTNTGTTLGVIRYTVTPTANGCPGATFTVDVTVNPNPVGSASPQTICSGATSNVALSSTVGSTTYTWTAAIQTTPTGGTITGFSNSSGTPIAQTLTNTGTTAGVIRYTVTPTANGCPGATFTVDVTVNPKPVGSASPQTICSGATSNVALSSTVGSTTYTWTAAIQTTPTGGTITGFSNSSGTPIAQTLTNTGTTLGVIRYTVTPTANGCPGATFTVDVTVNPNPVGSASPQTICSGATSNVALSSTVGSTTYTWTAAIQTTPTGGTITGFSNSSGTPIAQTLTNTGTTAGVIRYTVTPTANGCSGSAFTVDVTVNPTPTVNAVSNQTVCKGSNTAAVTFSGAVGSTVYNWTNTNTAIGLAAGGSGNIAAFSAQNPGATTISGTITVTPSYTNAGATCTGTPITFTITVNPTATITAPSNLTFCNGVATGAITFSGPVTWTNNNVSIGLAASGSNNIASFTATNPGTAPVVATISVTPTANGCNGNPVNFNITVNPTPTLNSSLGPIARCNNVSTTYTATSATSGVTWSWTRAVVAGISNAAGSGSSIATNLNITETLNNTTANPVNIVYAITLTANGCSNTQNVTITINPAPTVITPLNQAVCAGSPTAAINFTGAVSGTTYSWTNDNTSIGLAASGSGNIASFTAINGTSSAALANLVVTPNANGCAGATAAFTITVNPVPAITAIADSICSGSPFTETPVDVTNGVVPATTTYTWPAPVVTAGISGGAAGSGSSITGTLSNSSTTTPGTATYTVTPTAGTCPGPSFQVIIKVNPNPPKGDASFFQNCTSNMQTLCNGQQVGGGGQNDLDVETQPGCVQPATGQWDLPGWDYDWEYSNSGIAGPYLSAPTILGTHYQGIMPPYPSVFSTLGDHYMRFRLTNAYNCTSYSDTIDLLITSTLAITAGGPYVACSSATPGAIKLAGASITGTATSTVGGYWTIISGGGSLTLNNIFTTRPDTVSYTPAANFAGTALLKLTSIDPDGAGICNAVFDTARINIQSSGSGFTSCTDPLTSGNWTLTNTHANGTINTAQDGCGVGTLVGGDGAPNTGLAGITDYWICSGKGNFSFNWSFIAPVTASPVPVWQAGDNQTFSGNSGASFTVNKPTNLAAGDLIIITLHFRRYPPAFNSIPAGFTLITNTNSGAGQGGPTTQATVISYWKIATAAEPATYTFTIPTATNSSNWRIEAGRVTGVNAVTPIGNSAQASKTTSSGTITVPSVNTTQNNSLLVAALTVTGNISNPFGGGTIAPTGMTTVFNNNTQTSARVATMGIATAGATGTQTFNWRTNNPSAAQIFVINPATSVIEGDTAYTIINGVQTLLTGKNGSSGTASIAVNTGDHVGFRITTTSNTGGPGKLTFYNLVVPNDTPKVTGIAAITMSAPACNPTPAQISAAFVTPTATDNCQAPTLVSGYPATGTVVANGCTSSQTRTWVYVDNCGLQSLPFVQTVTWSTDLVPPVLTCPPNQNLCFVVSNNYSIPTLSATDGCPGVITYSYSITGNTTRSGSGNDASGLFNIGTSTITWTAIDACGNSANCTTTVTIAVVPTATISGSTSVCSGGSATISVALTGTAPWSITYTNGGAPVTVNNILTTPYTFNTGALVSNTTYSLTAASDARCSGTVSGSATITVRPLPTAVISGTTSICVGGSATISIAPTGTAPWSVTYTDGVTPTTVNNILTSPYTFVVSPATTTTYTITAVSDANCIGTFSGSAVITVNPKPTILINGANPASASVCLGSGGVTLTASGASTYSWSPATGLSATTGSTVTANPGSTTTYTVTGTDANGCVNTATVTVTVNTPPVTAGVTICQGVAGTISYVSGCAGGTFNSGPKNAGRGVDSAAIGSGVWQTPNEITVPGSPYATQNFVGGTLALPKATDYLKGTNYGFAIPAGATINTITVVISRQVAVTINVRDSVVEFLKAGALFGGNLSTSQAWSNAGFTTATFSIPGTGWAASDINDPNFGVVLSAKYTSATARQLDVDYMQITVNYTVSGSTNWYTASSGGTLLGSGSPFNPVGVVGSGLPDTNTPGTYTFYAECTTVPGCRTATNFVINPSPTITPDPAAADVCLSSGAQTTTLNYTATNAPTTYSITWNAAATTAGFAPVTNAALPLSPITIVVPANAPANTYTGTITVKNANGCTSSTGVNFTVTVDPVTVGGSLPSVLVCASGTGTLTLTGSVGNVIHWESSIDGGSTWTIIANNTTSLTYTATSVTTLYRVLVQSGVCSSAYSTVSTVGIHNVWTGATSIDWNDGTNWSDGVVPTTACPDVFIPGVPTQPTLSGPPTATITNLHILAGGFLTVNGTGLLQIGGTISNAGVFDASTGTVEFNSTTASQTIAANTFMNNAIHNLIISNSNAAGVSLAGPLNVFGSLTFGAAGTQFASNNNLTLKSTVTETASLGDLTGHAISGNVTVERYIATGNTGAPNHGKSWQMLAVPATGQTINQSWMEGATASNIGLPAGSNPNPGFGTMITSDVAGAGTWPTPGFDVYTSPGPSIKAYDYVSTGFIGPANTQAPIYNQKGWYLFVRGDRSVFTSAGAATPTILRTKGQLFTPANPPPVTTVVANKFESIGNPYASAIDKRTVHAQETGGVNEFFFVWDPRLGGSYGYGAYQTFSLSGTDYIATPGGGSYGPFGTINNVIQSGQAFLVQATGSNGTVSFAESAKVGGSALVTSPNPVSQTQSMLRISLNAFNSDGSTSLLDGVLIDYSDAYSNAVDGMDARKSLNTGENLSIKVGGVILAIERAQPPTVNDTIFLNITGEIVQPYQFSFDATNVSTNVQAFLVDSYLGTRTPLSLTGSTNITFSVLNIAGSKAANRFMIVFEPLGALPVTITNLKAYWHDGNINVAWKVAGERNMKQYEVEKSTDGISFTKIDVKPATGNNGGSVDYIITDAKPADGYNYYRIRIVDVNGKTGYTNVVKVLVNALRQDIVINPNPITDGVIHLQLVNQPAGRFGIRLLNKLGQLIIQKQINHPAGSSTELIKWDYNLAHGVYQLEVTKPDGSIKDLNVMY